MTAAAPRGRDSLPWWAPGLILLAFWFLLKLDPLGAGSASSQRSEQGALRIAAPLYTSSGRVTVLLIDDQYVALREASWPLTYAEQGLILRRVLGFEPSAVFIDLLYRHAHASESDRPEDLLRAIPTGAASTPIVIPALAAPLVARDARDETASYCESSLREGASRATSLIAAESVIAEFRSAPRLGLALVGWSGCRDKYPLMLAGDPANATPAYALYRALCERGLAHHPCPGHERYATPMIVRWGAYAPRAQTPFYAASVCQRSAPDGNALVRGLTHARVMIEQFLLGALTDLRQVDDPNRSLPCAAIDVLPAAALLDAPRSQLEPLLAGRTVLIGARVSGVPDWYTSPVHGQVPGVLLHAMALDNLLQLGEGYTRSTPEDVLLWLTIAAALFIAYSMPWLLGRPANARRQKLSALIALGIWSAVALFYLMHGEIGAAVFTVVVAAGFDLLKPTQPLKYFLVIASMALSGIVLLAIGWSPWNWVAFSLAILAHTHTMKPFYVSEERKSFPHKASALAAMARRLARSARSLPMRTRPTLILAALALAPLALASFAAEAKCSATDLTIEKAVTQAIGVYDEAGKFLREVGAENIVANQPVQDCNESLGLVQIALTDGTKVWVDRLEVQVRSAAKREASKVCLTGPVSRKPDHTEPVSSGVDDDAPCVPAAPQR